MMIKRKVPKRIYEYRAFDGKTLETLIEDRLYFAEPKTFNDPMDTNPSIETDIDAGELEDILASLVKQRITSEMTAAARSIKYKGPKTLDHIERQSCLYAEHVLSEIRYNATNPEYENADPLKFLLGSYVEGELLRRYDRGIVSFAQRSDCPLMWSHYGDQHRGLAFGYSVPPDAAENLHEIQYGGSRLVKASKIAAMLSNDEGARREVDEAVLLRKAKDWRYEKEWRLIGKRGLQDSLLELKEVIFGLRCPLAVRFVVAAALGNRSANVELFEMSQEPGAFVLKKNVCDMHEEFMCLPRRARDSLDAAEMFAKIPEPSGTQQ